MRRHNPSMYTSAAAAKRAGYGNTGYTKAELLALLRKRAKENDTDGALVIAAEAVAKGADPHVVDSIFRGSSLAIEGTHGNPRRRNPADFMDALHQHLDIGDRVLRSRGGSLGGSTLFLNFYNLPESVLGARAGGGAEAENNRMMFSVEPVAGGKVKLEHSVNALGRGYSLRGKTGTPAAVAKYLADHLNKVVREVPPNFTHTRSNPRRRNPAKKATASASLIEGLKELTEYNNHAEALVRLSVATDVAASGKATLAPSGLSELTREVEAILAARDRKGYMDEALSERSYAAYKKLMAKAKRVYTAASYKKIHDAL